MAGFVAEVRVQKGFHQIFGERAGDYARTEHEDVHVVVFDALVRGIGVVANGGADAVEFVGGDGGADAAAADENAAFDRARLDGFADGLGEIGIIARLRVVSAEIDNAVAEPFDERAEVILQFEPGVIGGDGDFHFIQINTAIDFSNDDWL